MPSAKLVCLLPVRNGEADLPGYFASVARFADAVVALDDGSTDQTRAMMDANPLFKVVLDNPPRRDYCGWDDAANRNRLLRAAAELQPEWIISLDADEHRSLAFGADDDPRGERQGSQLRSPDRRQRRRDRQRHCAGGAARRGPVHLRRAPAADAGRRVHGGAKSDAFAIRKP